MSGDDHNNTTETFACPMCGHTEVVPRSALLSHSHTCPTVSADHLDLDAIDARAERAHRQKERLLDAHGPTHQEATLLRSAMDVPALVAEVRRLRQERDALRTSVAGLRASLGFKQGTIDDLAATVERLEADAS